MTEAPASPAQTGSTQTGPLVTGGLAQLPNILTVFRVVAGPLMIPVWLAGGTGTDTGLLVLFIVAGLTDFLDGWLARRWRVTSRLGAALDPVADKVLILCAFVLLTATGDLTGLHLLAVVLIIAREFVVAGLRQTLGDVPGLTVTFLAKSKTTAQILACGLLLAGRIEPFEVLSPLGLGVLWLAAIMTVWSGADYMRAILKPGSAETTEKAE